MDMNIRNFPEELMQELKTLAVKEGSSLRETVIGLIETYLMEKHPSPALGAYIDKAYPEDRTELMAKMRIAKEALARGEHANIAPLTDQQRAYLKEEEQELAKESAPAPSNACRHCGRTGVTIIGGTRRCIGCNRTL